MRRGFTLAEVVVSTLVLTVLAVGVAALLADLRVRREAIVETGAASRAADAVIDALESDLTATFVAARTGDAGVTGDAGSITVRSRAAVASLDARGGDPAGAIRRTVIRFDEAESRVLMARSADDEAGPEAMPARIAGLRFRYHDGSSWAGSFDSARAGRLPVAVEVIVLFGVAVETDEPASDDGVFGMLGGAAGMPAPDETFASDPFDAWLTNGRRRVIVIPDAVIAPGDADQTGGAP